MSKANKLNNSLLVLDTGLFNDRETLSAALRSMGTSVDIRQLNPEEMNDGDWDEILNLVLSATRVMTL